MAETLAKGNLTKEPTSITPPNIYHIDDVIDAWVKGVSHGELNAGRHFIELLTRNIKDTQKFLDAVVNELAQLKINIANIYLRIGQWPEIAILLALSESDYLREDISPIYDKIYSLEKEYNDGALEICFSFLPLNDYFEENKVIADGYRKLAKKDK